MNISPKHGSSRKEKQMSVPRKTDADQPDNPLGQGFHLLEASSAARDMVSVQRRAEV